MIKQKQAADISNRARPLGRESSLIQLLNFPAKKDFAVGHDRLV